MPDERMSSAGAKTLDNGLRILRTSADAGPTGRTVAELARATALDRTVAHRLVATLCHHNLLRRLDNGRFVAGFGLLSLAAAVRGDLRTAAADVLPQLAERVGATAHVSILDGDHVVSVAVAEPRAVDIHVAYRVGSRHPAAVGAAGMAILLGRPPKRGERAEVTTGRRLGFVVSHGEIQRGAWGLAAPVRELSSTGASAQASVGVVALQPLDVHQVAAAVVDTAERIAVRSAVG